MVIDKTSQCGTEWAVRGEASSRGRRQAAALWPTAPQMGPESKMIPWWKVVDTPPRSRQESVNSRRVRAKRGVGGVGGERHDGVSSTAWSVPSAVGQLSALLSSLGFMSDTIYLAVKPRQASHSPLSLSHLLYLTPPLSLSLSISLVAVPLCPLIPSAKALNGLQHALLLRCIFHIELGIWQKRDNNAAKIYFMIYMLLHSIICLITRDGM